MKEKLYRFMQGRYGIDEFSRLLATIGLIIVVISSFIDQNFLYIIGFIVFVYGYYRVFSKNHSNRVRENQKYLYYVNKVKKIFKEKKNVVNIRKTHHVYSCPNCKQKIKIPRGKGKIEVTCPMCQTKFIKKR